MLPDIIRELADTVEKVTVDKVSVIDAGGGNGHGTGLGRFVSQFPAAVISLSEQIENATGVSILSSLDGQAKPGAPVKPVKEARAAATPVR